jgi:hypothetical protein
MAEVNLNGKTLNVDDETARRMLNVAEKSDISSLLEEFWTEDKLGKQSADLKHAHGSILLKDLQVDLDLFKEDLMSNRLKLGNFSSSLNSIMTGTKLKDDLKSSYIQDCLSVNTVRPAIGKGEFLFAASFKNIGFSKSSGDLVDLDTGSKIEVKGISACLGNSQNGRFKPMSKSLIWSICRLLGIDDIADYYLNPDNAKKIKERIGLNRDLAVRVFTFLQNLREENEAIAKTAAKMYFEKKQLMKTVAAVHLYTYMKLEKDQYLLLVNDEKFSIFRAPDDLYESYDIIDKLNLKSWREGDYGIKVSLR